MHPLKIILYAMLSLVPTIACLSCSQEQKAAQADPAQDLTGKPGVHSPVEVFQDFYQAIQARDDDRLLDLIHVEAPIWNRERFQDYSQRQTIWKKYSNRIRKTQSEARILEEQITGDVAELKVEFAGPEDSTRPRTFDFSLHRQTGQWKLWLTGGVIQLSAIEKKAPAETKAKEASVEKTAPEKKKKSPAGGAMKLNLDLKKKPVEKPEGSKPEGDKDGQ